MKKNKEPVTRRKQPIKDRFYSKIKFTDSCWLWTASGYLNGYGVFWDGKKLSNAHRFSFILHKGKIPSKMNICHTCDNRRCVKPAHLFLATQKENIRDMHNKKRGRKIETYLSGSDHVNSKLNKKEVLKIREVYKTGNHSYRQLAKMFKVSKWCVGCIINYRTYKNV